jgi:tetratricopeptide (TPR) repeat protein
MRCVLPFGIVLAAGLAAWWGAWNGAFVFDDLLAIVQNGALREGHWWQAAFGDVHQPLANRPLSTLSLSIDFAVFGYREFGPHLTNVLLHLANALLLFATVRRCLRSPNLVDLFEERRATWLATSIAALWVAHPLAGDVVCYATQRSTLLFSGGLLAALWCTLRAHGSPHRSRWHAAAVAAMAGAMASKEDAIVGPLLIVLLERAFVLPSWSASKARAAYYGAHATTWFVLAICLALGPRNPTVGYDTAVPVTAWEWLMTQAGVVAHYLRLVVWPHPLRGAYDWGIVRDLADAWLPGAFVLAVLGVAIAAWSRPRWLWLGFLGALFFLLLAPTSTVMPIVSEVVAERRVYLPMLFVVVPIVAAAERTFGRLPAVALPLLALTVGVLAWQAHGRVEAHSSEVKFWAEANELRDPEARTYLAGLILANWGDLLYEQGRRDEAYLAYDLNAQCSNQPAAARGRHAMSLLERHRPAEAVDILRPLAAMATADAGTLGMFGISLWLLHRAERAGPDDPRLAEAENALRASLAKDQSKAIFWGNLAAVAFARGRQDDAAEACRRALQIDPTEPTATRLRKLLPMRSGR